MTKNIKDVLGGKYFLKFKVGGLSAKKGVQTAIYNHLKEKIPIESISYNKSVVVLKINNPFLKNEILVRKEAIIKEANNHSDSETISDLK